MRAFVSGVTGLAGSHLAEHLLDCGDEVLGTSRGGQWTPEIPPQVSRQVPLLAWDLTQPPPPDVLEGVTEFAPEAIYHLGAISIPADCGREQVKPLATAVNVDGSVRVAELAGQLPQRPRIVFVSSCYVYEPVSHRQPRVDESWPTQPARAYGRTKLAAERAMQATASAHGLEIVTARSFQHTGPRQSPRMIVPDWARQFVAGRDPIRVVCLDTFLDLSDVRDVVRAYRALLLDGKPGEVYNVGSGQSQRSGDLFDTMRQQWDSSRRVVEIAPGRRQHPIADLTRITTRTSWHPEIDIGTTLADTLQYWKKALEAP